MSEYRTVIALFRRREDAEGAARELAASGIPLADVAIRSAGDGQPAEARPQSDQGDPARQRQGGLLNWLIDDLGEMPEERRTLYRRGVAEQGHALLVVRALQSREASGRLTAIIARHAPIDMNGEPDHRGMATSTEAALGAPEGGAAITPAALSGAGPSPSDAGGRAGRSLGEDDRMTAGNKPGAGSEPGS